MKLHRALKVRHQGAHKRYVALVRSLQPTPANECDQAGQRLSSKHRGIQSVVNPLRNNPIVVELATPKGFRVAKQSVVANMPGAQVLSTVNKKDVPRGVVRLVRRKESGVKADLCHDIA